MKKFTVSNLNITLVLILSVCLMLVACSSAGQKKIKAGSGHGYRPAVATRPPSVRTATAKSGAMIITQVVHHKTPQSGTWLHCFKATSGSASATHNISEDKHKGTDAAVDMQLRLTPVNSGDLCRFSIGLDDDQGDVCSAQAEDQTDGTFSITGSGSQNFSAGDNWNFTIYWRME